MVLKARHRRVGKHQMPIGNRSFSPDKFPDKSKRPREFLDHTKIGEGLRELEEALEQGGAPKNAGQLDRSLRYAETLPSKELTPEYYRNRRRFYALAEVHGLVDEQGRAITPPNWMSVSTKREIVEAGLRIFNAGRTKEYSPSETADAIRQLSETKPDTAIDLLSKSMQNPSWMDYLSDALGRPKENITFLHVLDHYQLTPMHMPTTEPRYDA